MKKYLLILILLICTLITSCTLPGQNQGNINQNDIYYKVSFDSNFGSFVDSQEIKQGELAIKPVDPTKENFRFLYWTLNNVEYDFNTPVTSNIKLVAIWEEVGVHTHFYTSNVISPSCTEKGYTEHICSCGDTFKDSYIDELGHDEEHHPAKSPTSTEIGWEEYVTCTRCSYTTFKEISKVTVEELEIYEENGRKYVNFGSYPQTHVADQELIASLNKLTETNERGYYEFEGNEYAKIISSPYNYGSYNETNEYGFTTTKYYTYSTGKTVEYGVTEWFKVEPIKWRILSNTIDGTYQLLSEYILTQKAYHGNLDYRLIDGVDIAPNNYKYSSIREFLNNTFLNSAFTVKQQESILITEVDNRISSTTWLNNQYICENTFDKIYLLSCKDTLNTSYGFSSSKSNSDESRRAIITDYAKAIGCCWNTSNEYLDMGYWWLRSPCGDYYQRVHAVSVYGEVDYSILNVSRYGVRPAIAIAI